MTQTGKSRLIVAAGSLAVIVAAAVYLAANVGAVSDDGQNPQRPASVKSPAKEFFPEPSAAETRILAALDEPTTLEFTETPLQDVIDYLKAKHKIEIQVDSRALEDLGVALDTPITRHVRDVKLRSALRLLLGDLDLAYLVGNEVLVITSQDKAEGPEGIFTRTYPVGDLIETHVVQRIEAAEQKDKAKPARIQLPKSNYDAIVEAITTSVKPQTWDEVGGPGSISPVAAARSLVVCQTRDVQDEILELLRALRAARDAAGPGEPTITERVIVVPSQEDYERYLKSLPTRANKTGGGMF